MIDNAYLGSDDRPILHNEIELCTALSNRVLPSALKSARQFSVGNQSPFWGNVPLARVEMDPFIAGWGWVGVGIAAEFDGLTIFNCQLVCRMHSHVRLE